MKRRLHVGPRKRRAAGVLLGLWVLALSAATGESFVVPRGSSSSCGIRPRPQARRFGGCGPRGSGPGDDVLSSPPKRGKAKRKNSPSTKNKYPSKKKNRNFNNKKGNKFQRSKQKGTFSPMVCRQLNQEITRQETAMDLLNVLASKKGALTTKAGGGVLNSINFSTSLHRIARNTQRYNRYGEPGPEDHKNDRTRVLKDPRFAFLICGAAEYLVPSKERPKSFFDFGSRELANMAWAIAKLKIVPPQKAMPIEKSAQTLENRLHAKSEEIRSMVFEVAKARQSGGSASAPWIPALSELLGLIMDTVSFQVQQLDPRGFRLQELANLLWAMATSERANEDFFRHVIQSILRKTEYEKNQAERNGEKLELYPQEWSNSMWALATSGIQGAEDDFIPFLADLISTRPGFLDQFKPQELSNTIWGLATILNRRSDGLSERVNDAALSICRNIADQLKNRSLERFKSQELVNSIWAMATLGFGIPLDAVRAEKGDYTYLNSEDPEGDKALALEAIQTVLDHAKQTGIYRYRSQELNNMSWAIARMGLKDMDIMGLIAAELIKPRRKVKSQDIGTSLWGMASSEYKDEQMYRAIVSRWTPEMAQRAKPQELSNTLWALATSEVFTEHVDSFDNSLLTPRQRQRPNDLRSDPVLAIFAMAAQELMRRPDQFIAQEIKDILWAFSRNGIRHPDLFRTVAEYLVGKGEDPNMTGRGLSSFSCQGTGNLAWAYARHAQLGAETIQRFKGNTLLPKSSGRLSHYTVAFSDIGESLIQKLFYNIAENNLYAFDNLKQLTAQDIANTVWAFAIIGLKHTQFLNAVGAELIRRTSSGEARGGRAFFSQQELTNAVWALSTLNHRIPGLMEAITPTILSLGNSRIPGRKTTAKSIANAWMLQELANLAWSCAVFGEYPKPLVELLYMGLCGVGDDVHPRDVAQNFGDSYIGKTAATSLTYLQIVMDLELGEDNEFALPEGFPQNFDQAVSNASGTSRRLSATTNEDLGGLTLTTSRIQSEVSQALSRIGWDHVEEYTMDMEWLVEHYGIQMERIPQEILSLDMANLAENSGIEVDGPGHFVSVIGADNGSDVGWNYRNGVRIHEAPNGKKDTEFLWDWTTARVNGPTALKSRILELLGWEVTNFPFWEWAPIQGDFEAEEAYCRERLS